MDEIILLAAFQLFLIAWVVFSRRSKHQKSWHIATMAIYCAIFYALIFFRGDGGSSLLWLFYLAILSVAHFTWLVVTSLIKTRRT